MSSENTCKGCGLWWLPPNDRPVLDGRDQSGSSTACVLPLRRPFAVFASAVVLGFGVFGWGTVLLALDSVRSAPRSVSAWAVLLVALLVGGVLGAGAFSLVASELLHFVMPSRLVCDAEGMRVELWETWSGTWARLLRRRTVIPRGQLRGVTHGISQGGAHQLFIVHASGWSFGTGWEGSEQRHAEHAREIAGWLGGTAALASPRGQ